MSSANRRCGGRRPERAAAALREDNANGYVETDPTGRYGRFDELLGKGAMKSVYRAFDEELGMEVAWNQADLTSILRSQDTIQRTYSEVHLLRSLQHPSIISFHASWIDLPRRTFNFITELFVSGTLRSYRRRHPRVSLAAVRRWARQLLAGLSYLHSRAPPVIHRDLKCDNIFVHGHLGQLKIGDLGLAAVLEEGGVKRSVVGTPEFMAPEMYDEEYDEKVDVYAFGMCVLEMITGEYPYGECENPAQIFKKVTAGRLPDAFFRVEDCDARRFIGRCLVSASDRPSADELLLDPFLDGRRDDGLVDGGAPAAPPSTCSSFAGDDEDDEVVNQRRQELEEAQQTPTMRRSEMSITGKVNAEEDTVFLKVQMMVAGGDGDGDGEEEGKKKAARNIYFPFDVGSDTAEEVAEEMVKELEIKDWDATEIAAMIQQEIDRLLPGRRRAQQQQQQHEYTYGAGGGGDDDDDDVERPPPFCCGGYLSSSPATSHGSHSRVGPYYASSGGFPGGPRGGGWSKDHHHWYGLSDNDDDTTSSLHSGKYSPLHYASGADEAAEPPMPIPPPSCSSSKTTTRFSSGSTSGNSAAVLARQLHRHCSVQSPPPPQQQQLAGGGGRRRRLTRNRSMVDMRSQVLHRTLVEELNRRLFFNTVGAVENIGFRDPTTTSPSSSSSSSSAAARGRGGRRSGGGGGNKQPLDDKQRYFML